MTILSEVRARTYIYKNDINMYRNTVNSSMKMMTRRLLCWPGTAEWQFERLDPRSGRAHSEDDDETLVVMTERGRAMIRTAGCSTFDTTKTN